MKAQFQHNLTSSFFMWFDNFLLTKGEAYTNKTGEFFYYDDTLIDSDYTVFGSPYKQWVSDSSIDGATVPTGVYVNGNLSGSAKGVRSEEELKQIINYLLNNEIIPYDLELREFSPINL